MKEAFKILTKVYDLVKANYRFGYELLVKPHVDRGYKMFPLDEDIIDTACQLNNTKAISEAIKFSKT